MTPIITEPLTGSYEAEQAATQAPEDTYAVLAEFEDVDSLLHAAIAVRDRGFTRWDCHTPFPVHHLNGAMGMRPTKLPLFVLVGGITGAVAGLVLQLYTMSTEIPGVPTILQGYKYIISGKPYMSGPAYIPIIFELTILLSALTTFGGMLLMNRLPWLYNPLFKSERFKRATDDRFFVVIRAADPFYEGEKTHEFLRSLDAVAVETVDD